MSQTPNSVQSSGASTPLDVRDPNSKSAGVCRFFFSFFFLFCAFVFEDLVFKFLRYAAKKEAKRLEKEAKLAAKSAKTAAAPSSDKKVKTDSKADEAAFVNLTPKGEKKGVLSVE